MEIFATILAVACIIMLAWQILGSFWNIISILLGLFRKQKVHEGSSGKKE